MKVKICGITNIDDALMAEELGADYIGLIFAAESPRAVSVAQARAMAPALRRARLVGVFVRQTLSEVERIAAEVPLDAVQHYRRYRRPPRGALSIRALRVRDRRALTAIERSPCDFVLLDAHVDGAMGGTGGAFDWSLLPRRLDRVFLAGGIGPENVRAAAALRPFAVDVCSRVERCPGTKDPAKLRRLFEEFRS
jgi:phosphoribosylanthranilate isomerase